MLDLLGDEGGSHLIRLHAIHSHPCCNGSVVIWPREGFKANMYGWIWIKMATQNILDDDWITMKIHRTNNDAQHTFNCCGWSSVHGDNAARSTRWRTDTLGGYDSVDGVAGGMWFSRRRRWIRIEGCVTRWTNRIKNTTVWPPQRHNSQRRSTPATDRVFLGALDVLQCVGEASIQPYWRRFWMRWSCRGCIMVQSEAGAQKRGDW